MQATDTAELASFRAEVQRFIATQLPPELRESDQHHGAFEARVPVQDRHPEAFGRWRQANRQQGWLAPAWPAEHGGAGLDAAHQFVLTEEYLAAGAPRMAGIGLSMAGPTIIAHGTAQQKRELLPGILERDDRWCELFSEPGAGSDLAALQTSAVRDGDEYVVNGQKIWTSGGARADKALLLARTDRDAPKHRGISMFVLDMHSPGISVLPLVNLTGTAGEFCQEFFENVRVPAANLIGEENRGWYCVMTTLDVERSAVSQVAMHRRTLAATIELARSVPAGTLSAAVRHELANRVIEVSVLRGLSERMVVLQNQRKAPNHEASVLKLFHTELSQRLAATAMQVIGLYGLLYRGAILAPLGGMVAMEYLYAASRTIQVGTSEVQRNIIATRGLGLPRS